MWYTLFWVLLFIGAVTLVAGIVLFFVLDSMSASAELSGKKRRERIRKLERANQSSDGLSTTDLYNDSSKSLDTTLADIEIDSETGTRRRLPSFSRTVISEEISTSETVSAGYSESGEDNLVTGQVQRSAELSDSEDYGTGVWESGYADDIMKTPFSADRSVAVVFERSSVV